MRASCRREGLAILREKHTATVVARTIEPCAIYDARLTDEEVGARQRASELPPR